MPTLVHTILLYQDQTDIPDQLLHSLNKVLKDCDAWWATKGAGQPAPTLPRSSSLVAFILSAV